jgi:hypothetical protein
MTTYQLVQCIDDEFHVSTFNAADFLSAMEIRGYAHAGAHRSPSTRAELQGQPKFTGVLGPMWGGLGADGEPCIRYEDSATYQALSQ